MRLPVNDYKTLWNTTAGLGFGVKLPFLKAWIFSVIGGVVDFHVATKTNSSKIFFARVSSIFIKMVNQKSFFLSTWGNVVHTQFTRLFKKMSIKPSSVFKVRIGDVIQVPTSISIFSIFLSLWRNHLAFIRAIFCHTPSINFITWSYKWFLTKQTLEYIINPTLRHTRLFTKSFPNNIRHEPIIYGLHEGVNL